MAHKPALSHTGPAAWLFPLLTIIVPLLLYVMVLMVPWISTVESNAIALLVVASGMLLVFLAYQLPERIGTLISLSVTLMLFAWQLSCIWSLSGPALYSVFGGILPWSDAYGYYTSARLLLEGEHFNSLASRRPLFAGLLAGLLGLTGGSLQASLALLVLANGIAAFLLIHEVQRTHGAFAAPFVLGLLFFFYRRFVGTTLTEHLGLLLGITALTVLWRGTGQKRMPLILLGMFLLTLALNARAGAFFVLPALLLWGGWFFRGNAFLSWRFLIGGSAAVALGFALNTLVLKVVGSPDAEAFSNFSYVIYGLVSGGKGWRYVMGEHPGVSEGREMYLLAWEAFRANPTGIVVGAAKAWRDYITPFWMGMFGFVSVISREISAVIRLPLIGLSVLGLVRCFRQRHDAHCSLILAAMMGIFLSVPFAPPIDADMMRAYAATNAITIVLSMLGIVPALALLQRGINVLPLPRRIEERLRDAVNRLHHWLTMRASSSPGSALPLAGFAIGIIILVVGSPLVVSFMSHRPDFAQAACPDHLETWYVRMGSGAEVHIVDDNAVPHSRVPTVRVSDFRRSLAYTEVYNRIRFHQLEADHTVFNSFDLAKNHGATYFSVMTPMLPDEPGIVRVCGKREGVFHGDSLLPVAAIASTLDVIAEADEALERNPRASAPYLTRGNALVRLGHLERAWADFEQAIQHDPQASAPYLARGRVLAALGDVAQAYADFDQAIEHDPQNLAAYQERGDAALELGKTQEAVQDFAYVATNAPDEITRLLYRGKQLHYQGNLEEALDSFTQVLALDTENSLAYEQRGLVYLQQGDLVQARADFTQALLYHPGDAPSYRYRGRIYRYRGLTSLQEGKIDHAQSDFTQALLRYPYDVEAYVYRIVAAIAILPDL